LETYSAGDRGSLRGLYPEHERPGGDKNDYKQRHTHGPDSSREREVVTVSGNDLVVKMAMHHPHFDNVPESARATVDGQQLGIHDLKPGMKLQSTITTTTTPKTITTVQSVTGTVWFVSSAEFSDPDPGGRKEPELQDSKNQKFNVDGQMVDAWA